MSKRWPEKTVIGVTGNIATGKSVVRRMLEHLGAFGIDADGLGHRAMSPGAPAYKPVVETFGRWILSPDGRINRQKLGSVVFTFPEALVLLEKITHPIIGQVIDLLIRRSKQEVVIIEAIKLFEVGLADDCDAVWVVDAPRNIQVQRLIENRKMSEDAANTRIDAQPLQAEKLEKATLVIQNDGGYEATWEQVQEAYNKLLGIEAPEEEPEEDVQEAISAADIPADAEITARRGGPQHAQAIANFFNQLQGLNLTRTDVLVRFGQKAYMLAYANQHIVGLAGWQVENLIARVDEFLLLPDTPVEKIIPALIDTIEKAAHDLQSEISLLFLEKSSPTGVFQAVKAKGYEIKTADDLLVPDWKEAAKESAPPDTTMVFKRLREDRVLKPL